LSIWRWGEVSRDFLKKRDSLKTEGKGDIFLCGKKGRKTRDEKKGEPGGTKSWAPGAMKLICALEPEEEEDYRICPNRAPGYLRGLTELSFKEISGKNKKAGRIVQQYGAKRWRVAQAGGQATSPYGGRIRIIKRGMGQT